MASDGPNLLFPLPLNPLELATATVDRLADAQEQTGSQVAELTKAQTRTESQVATLADVVQSLAFELHRRGNRLDTVLGWTFEMRFRDRLTSSLGRLMRRGKLLRNDEVLDAIEQALDADEADEVLRADAIATGIIDGVASHVAVEVSATCAADDIDRAHRRRYSPANGTSATMPTSISELMGGW